MIFPAILNFRITFPWSEEPATGPYTEPDECRPQLHTLFQDENTNKDMQYVLFVQMKLLILFMLT
jgi:hypothetical protein